MGVDTDEYFTTFANINDTNAIRPFLLTSLLKRADVAAERAVLLVNSGTFQPGTVVLDVENGGIDTAPCHESCEMWAQVGLQAKFIETKQLLASGIQSTGVTTAGFASAPDSLSPGSWLALKPFGDRPPLIHSHTSVITASDNEMLVFGGRSLETNSVSSRLFLYTRLFDIWQELNDVGSSRPQGRFGHSATLWHRPDGDLMVVYGGQGESTTTPFDDVWVFNTTSLMWRRLVTQGSSPGGRRFHSAQILTDNALYVFGGVDDTSRLTNSFHRLDLITNQWSVISSNVPPARSKHTACDNTLALLERASRPATVLDQLEDDTPQFFIFGGLVGDTTVAQTNTAFSYSLSTNTWRELIPAGNEPVAPEPRESAAMVFSQSRLIVYGGRGGRFYSDVWSYSLKSQVWQLQSSDVNTSSRRSSRSTCPADQQDFPLPRHQHSLVALQADNIGLANDQMMVFGGTTPNGNSNALYLFTIPNPAPIVERDFFSCDEKEEFTDRTGTVILDRSAGIYPSEYLCDDYIDCDNSWDEAFHCSPSVVAVYVSFGVLSAIFAVYIIISGIVIYVKRRHPIVRASSPLFLGLLLIGAMVGLGALFSFYPRPSDLSCHLQIWLCAIAFTLIFGSLFLKTWRIYRLFATDSYIVVRISNWYLVRWLLVILLCNGILCAIWSGVGDPHVELKREDDTQKEHEQCDSDHPDVFFWLMVALNGFLVAFGVFVSYKTRNVHSAFAESSYIGLSIYNFMIVGLFILPIVILLDDPLAIEVLRCLGIFMAVTIPVLLMTVPKFLKLGRQMDWDNEVAVAARAAAENSVPKSTNSTINN